MYVYGIGFISVAYECVILFDNCNVYAWVSELKSDEIYALTCGFNTHVVEKWNETLTFAFIETGKYIYVCVGVFILYISGLSNDLKKLRNFNEIIEFCL